MTKKLTILDRNIFFPSRDENRARITMYVASTKYLVSMILILKLKYIFKFFAHTSKSDRESIAESSLCCIESCECIFPHATDEKLGQLQLIVHSRSVSSFEWKVDKLVCYAKSPGSCQHGLILNHNFSGFYFKAWQLQAPTSATHTYNVVARLATLYVYFENIFLY